MRDTTHLTLVDIPLPRVVTSEAQINTDPVATAKAHATENAPQGTEMTITARDLPPIGTDPPARGPTVMTMMKTLKSVGDVDVRGGIVTGIGIVIGENPTICQINRRVPMTRPRCVREVTTEVMLGVTSTTLQVYTRAIIDTGMTMMRCPLRIILTVDSIFLADTNGNDDFTASHLSYVALRFHPLRLPPLLLISFLYIPQSSFSYRTSPTLRHLSSTLSP